MRSIGAAILATTLFASSAFGAAGTTSNNAAPLAPGKPAGVKQAQLTGPALMWAIGFGVIIGGAALVASGAGNGHKVSTSTNSTNP